MSTRLGPSSPRAPETIDVAARAVSQSLTSLTGRSITFRASRPGSGAPQQYAVDFDASGQQLSVFAFDESVPEAAMAMLNSLTDLLSERWWGTAIPPCPGHSHPLRPVCDDQGVVTWECPRDGRTVAQLWPIVAD